MNTENSKSNEDGEVYPLPIEDAENEDIVFVEIDTEQVADSINNEPFIQN